MNGNQVLRNRIDVHWATLLDRGSPDWVWKGHKTGLGRHQRGRDHRILGKSVGVVALAGPEQETAAAAAVVRKNDGELPLATRSDQQALLEKPLLVQDQAEGDAPGEC